MSLACFECEMSGAFNTLILYRSDGAFDITKPATRYANYYTDCASFDDFTGVEQSRFMIVRQREYSDCWATGTDGDPVDQMEYKLVDERELAAKLPKIWASLLEADPREVFARDMEVFGEILVAAVQAAANTPIDHGTRIRTTQPNMALRAEWSDEGWENRKWGVRGTIIGHSDSHGLCYEIQHADGTTGWYDPSEVEIVR